MPIKLAGRVRPQPTLKLHLKLAGKQAVLFLGTGSITDGDQTNQEDQLMIHGVVRVHKQARYEEMRLMDPVGVVLERTPLMIVVAVILVLGPNNLLKRKRMGHGPQRKLQKKIERKF
jgi:hypothetical protein